MNIYRYILSIAFVIITTHATGQTTPPANSAPQLPNIIPPSPTVANLMQFEAVPVDNYSGQADIRIPIIKKAIGSGIEIDLSLKYNTQGLKIQNRSGWTGTCWSLDAGGMVSRTVRGIPDEQEKGTGYNIQTGIYHLPDFWNYSTTLPAQDKNEFSWHVNGTNHEKFDCELDLYQFSAPGISGRFVVVMEGLSLVAKQLDCSQKFKIDLVYHPVTFKILSFTIIDALGNKFIFSYREFTHTSLTTIIYPQVPEGIAPDPVRPENDYVSAWHIVKIENNQGKDLATFNYVDTASTKLHESYDDPVNVTEYEFAEPSMVNSYYLGHPYNASQFKPRKIYTQNTTSITTQKLESIVFADGTTIQFETSEAGSHPETNGVYLTDVVYSYGQELKHFELQYETTSSRLWLTKVLENGLPYDISYISKQLLPAFTNDVAAIDAWGYASPLIYNSTHQFTTYNPLIHQIGILKSTKYPTGGLKEFVFETNRYSYEGTVKRTNFDDNPMNRPNASTNARLKIYNGGVVKQIINGLESNTLPTITLDFPQQVYITFDMNGFDRDYDLYQLYFYKIGDSNVVSLSVTDNMAVSLQAGTYTYKLVADFTSPVEPTLPPGAPIPDEIFVANFTLHYRSQILPAYYSHYSIGGGMRIKEIRFRENSDALSVIKKTLYNYDEPIEIDHELIDAGVSGELLYGNGENPRTSSGVLDNKVDNLEKKYPQTEQYWIYADNTYNLNPHQITVHYNVKSKGVNAELTRGNYIGYRHVMVSDENNGHSDYFYTSAHEFPSNGNAFNYPFVPSLNKDYKRGLLLKSTIYNQRFQRLSETTNTYDYIETLQAKSYILQEFTHSRKQFYDYYENWFIQDPEEYNKMICDNILCPIDYAFQTGLVSPYQIVSNHLNSGWAQLILSNKKDYFRASDSEPSVAIESSTSYKYNPDNYQLSEQIMTLMENDGTNEYRTEFHYPVGGYPADFTTEEVAAISNLVTNNIINVPIAVSTFKNQLPLQKTITKYNDSGLISTIATRKELQPLEDRIYYNEYDISGNPTDVSKAYGAHTSYIWGDNATTVIAKIENSEIEDVNSVLNPDEYTTYEDIDDLRDSAALNNAMVTTIVPMTGIGPFSITNARKEKNSFFYDSMQRVDKIKDTQENIIAEYDYHYKSVADPANWVKTISYNIASQTEISNPSLPDATVNLSFADGLGRTIQTNAYQQAANGKDIITHLEYDNLGRETKKYLPYSTTASSLALVSDAATATANYYNVPTYGNTINPYSETLYETSPLSRVIKQAAPGNDWSMANGHTIKYDYEANDNDEVLYFAATADFDPVTELYAIGLLQNGYYNQNTLYKTITYDENSASLPTEIDGATVEFKNQQGQVVLKRSYESQEKHDTYYVYDIYGNLTYVIPPLAADLSLNQDILDKLCYQYKYDKRNRLAEKKLPGKTWEFMVYDKLDRLVASGPTHSPFSDIPGVGWMITKYDNFDRPVVTGWLYSEGVDSAARFALQQNYGVNVLQSEKKSDTTSEVKGIFFQYTNKIFPIAYYPLTVNYYDNYDFPGFDGSFSDIENQPVYYNLTMPPKGLLTGTWIRALAGWEDADAVTSYLLYDAKARTLRSHTKYHLGGYTEIDSKYDFTKLLATVTRHKRTASETELYIKEELTYTDQGRIDLQTHQIGTNVIIKERMADNGYAPLGELRTKYVGGKVSGFNLVPYQKVDYRYNIRGWLTSINDINNLSPPLSSDPADLFAFKINYNTVANSLSGLVEPLYNGNISETFWNTESDNTIRKYGYQYDKLNRLLRACYQKNIAATMTLTHAYDERVTYDKNGNIDHLFRNGYQDNDNGNVFEIDELVYRYAADSNQLENITDTEGNPKGFKDIDGERADYKYDDFGNMKYDQNKGIENISYNHLNLPVEILFSSGNNIHYRYDALGAKLSKTITQGSTQKEIDYLGGFHYTDGALEFFPTPEGYVKVTDDHHYDYVYNYTDHLGNIRLSYTYDEQEQELKIMEENHYYPFGLKHQNYNTQIYDYKKEDDGDLVILKSSLRNEYQYKYNGKELQDELGLNLYDYGARNYDPAIGRWMNIDPKAEISRRWSPYNYCMNNPIFFIDPDGMKVINGETERRERLQAQNAGQKQNIDNKYGGNMNMSKKDFASKAEYKEYKSTINSFEKVAKGLEKSIKTETNIQTAIDDFAKTDPTNFQKADNLTYKDGSGNVQNIDVTINGGEASSFGGAVTKTGFTKNADGTFKSIASINTTLDFGDVKPVSNVLAHEMGHAYNNAQNPAQAMQDTTTINCQDPANRNSFQSKTARDWQDSYDTLKALSPK